MEPYRIKFGEYEVLAVLVLRGTYNTFNYLVRRDGNAVLIDAGEAGPIFKTLEKEELQLLKVLITHGHHDHVGACRAVQDRLGVLSRSPGVESGEFNVLGTVCRSFSTPGHVETHKCYHFPDLGIVFTGDTIINGGCGRIMGGTAEQYFDSLERINDLPDDTIVFGGHDYLMDNLKFALSAEPDNAAIPARLTRYATDPAAAIFVSLAEEKRTNPFLRAEIVDQFISLRERKDRF